MTRAVTIAIAALAIIAAGCVTISMQAPEQLPAGPSTQELAQAVSQNAQAVGRAVGDLTKRVDAMEKRSVQPTLADKIKQGAGGKPAGGG